MNKQTGYTLTELITVVFAFGIIVLVGFGLYAAVHFIAKLW